MLSNVFKCSDDRMTDELNGFSRMRGKVLGEVLLAKLILAYLVNKFHDPYGAIGFIAAFTRAHY
jgi:hypothetical protein